MVPQEMQHVGIMLPTVYWDERFSTAAIRHGLDSADLRNGHGPAAPGDAFIGSSNGRSIGRQRAKRQDRHTKQKGKGTEDAQAAAFILQSYLDYALKRV